MAGIGLNRSRQAPAQDTPSFGAIAERFRRAGDLDRAIALCEEGLKKFPNQLSARVTLGWALLDKGEYDLARQELERVIRRAPDNLAAIRGLAELHDRAEHAVTGLDSNGVWTPPEELSDEAAVSVEVPGASLVVDAQADFVEQVQVHAAPLPLPPLPVADAAAAEVDPQSLIETPAQAAVAHAGGVVEPAPAVEDALADISQPPAELVTPAALAIDGVDEAAPLDNSFDPMGAVDLAPATESIDAWVADAREPESALDAEPILFAENGEIELARMASELAASPSEVGVSDTVIDLPSADPDIEGAFFQFEDTSPQPVPSEGIALLDPQIDLPVVEAFDERMLDPELSPALGVALASAGDIDLGMSVEPEREVATVLAFDQTGMPDLDRESEWSGAVDTPGEVSGEPEPILIEAATVASEAIEISEVTEASALPEPRGIIEGPPSAETASASIDLPDATLEAPGVERAEQGPLEAGHSVGAWPEVAAEPEAHPASATTELAPTGIFAPIAHGDDQDDQAGHQPESAADDVEPRAELDESQDLSGLAAAASAQIPDTDADLFPMPAMAQEPVRSGPPIAALEGFLRKISARRLHLTPGSVA